MGLLHKGAKFKTIPINFLDLRGELVARSGEPNITVPALELPNGTFIYDSFRIAEWLEGAYPDAPSLFTGDGKPPRDAQPELVVMGKNYARLIDLGLGASKPEWAV
jgi:glutathione S-transferase